MTDRIGLIGLGQMGLPIAGRISGAFELVAYDLSEERRAIAAGLPRTIVTADLADVADARLLVLSLPTPGISRQVLGDIAPRLSAGTVVVETSTVLPDDVRDARRILEPAGIGIVDAAVLSGVAQMAQGAATLLVGGEDEDVTRVEPLLAVIGGGGVMRLGPLGAGMAAKVVNNGVAHAVMVVLVEAFAMARAEGVALEDAAAMLLREDGGLQRPLNHRMMDRVADGDFEGGMPLDAARKDSTLALAMAQRRGIPLFATQAAQTVYDLAASAGLGREDYAAIARLWEGWSGTDLRFGGDGR